jgi:hypothetical protein
MKRRTAARGAGGIGGCAPSFCAGGRSRGAAGPECEKASPHLVILGRFRRLLPLGWALLTGLAIIGTARQPTFCTATLRILSGVDMHFVMSSIRVLLLGFLKILIGFL